MAKKADIEKQIRIEWRKRPESKRTGNDVLIFYGEICTERPDLLEYKSSGDKYQDFKTFLRGLVVK